MKKKIKIAVIVTLLLLSLIALIIGVCKLLNSEPEGFKRQSIEESLADQFLKDMEKNGKRSEETEKKWYDKTFQELAGAVESETVPVNSDGGYYTEQSEESSRSVIKEADEQDSTDDNYYSDGNLVYTPDYAMGYLQCVLEIPKEEVQIRRGVYSGTKEEIAYDLSIWMVTAARPDYVLGETHYVIYGHNHTTQDLSFNRLRNICIGDEFYLTDVKGKRAYEVIGIHKMTREDVAYQIVDNFYIPSDYCYIVTCGRDDFRYYDLVVEGKIKEE